MLLTNTTTRNMTMMTRREPEFKVKPTRASHSRNTKNICFNGLLVGEVSVRSTKLRKNGFCIERGSKEEKPIKSLVLGLKPLLLLPQALAAPSASGTGFH
jgi:hypothetical protein